MMVDFWVVVYYGCVCITWRGWKVFPRFDGMQRDESE